MAQLEVGGGLPARRWRLASEFPLAQASGGFARRIVAPAPGPEVRHSDGPALSAVGGGRLCYRDSYFFKPAGRPRRIVRSGGSRHPGNHLRIDLCILIVMKKSGSPSFSTITCPEWAMPL